MHKQDKPVRVLTKAARRRARKLIPKAGPIKQPSRPNRPDEHSTETVLSKTTIRRIDGHLRTMQAQGSIDIGVLDYRWWECIRCRWNPRRVVPNRAGGSWRVYDWWCTLTVYDRRELVALSIRCGKDTPEMTEKRVQKWAKVRGI